MAVQLGRRPVSTSGHAIAVRCGQVEVVFVPGFESVDLGFKSSDCDQQVFGLLLLGLNCFDKPGRQRRDGAEQGDPPIMSAKATMPPALVTGGAIAVADRGHACDRPPDSVAEGNARVRARDNRGRGASGPEGWWQAPGGLVLQ